VLLNGQLQRVPLGPTELLTTSLLSLRTKLALLRDAVGRSAPPEFDESVAAFVHRKFTQELLDRLVGPFVSGVFAGDPERLSLRAAFPTVYRAEKLFGSIIRGAGRAGQVAHSSELREGSGKNPDREPIVGPRASRDPKHAPKQNLKHTLISFRKGNESLVQALVRSLGDSLICGISAKSVSYDFSNCNSVADDSARGHSPAPKSSARIRRFVVHATEAGRPRSFDVPALIVATPADVASGLLAPLSADFMTALADIEYAPVAVISSVYRVDQVARSLEGFGFLVPRGEGLRLLGTIWNTSLFAGRAPKGYAVLTSFAGGATDPGLVALPAQDIAALISKELQAVLSITGKTRHSAVKIYPHALPQYNLGHIQRIDSLRALCTNVPGLFLAGNYLEGPSIGACVEHARRVVALSVRNYLSSSSAGSIP
jgi:oxygen-dependent protoporphyrinogen oxidase